MNKIINGKKYSTETAKLIATHSNNLMANDFQFFAETLYLKKTGEYFLFGEGHGMSEYGEMKGNGGMGWGEIIKPFSENSAKNWAEKNLSGEEFEEIFGEVQE